MQAILLLGLLAQTPLPADPVIPIPVGSTLPEDYETTSLCRRTFSSGLAVHLGTDPRAYLIVKQSEWMRTSASASRDGIGLTYELYLGHGFSARIEARTLLVLGTLRVGMTWYPLEEANLPFDLDLLRGRLILPTREDWLEAGRPIGEGVPIMAWLVLQQLGQSRR